MEKKIDWSKWLAAGYSIPAQYIKTSPMFSSYEDKKGLGIKTSKENIIWKRCKKKHGY